MYTDTAVVRMRINSLPRATGRIPSLADVYDTPARVCFENLRIAGQKVSAMGDGRGEGKRVRVGHAVSGLDPSRLEDPTGARKFEVQGPP